MKGIIFDLDGTLLDTIDDLAAAVNFALEKNSFGTLSLSEIKENVGNGARRLIADSLPRGFEEPDYEKCFGDFTLYYREHLSVFTKPYDGVTELLSELKKRNIKTAILSNKPDRATKALAKLYFGDLIDVCSGERDGIPKKPDPSGIFALLSEMELKAEECLYAGDMDVDIMTAKNSGMVCISCLWGFRTREFLEKSGGRFFAETPKDILKFCR